LKLSDTLKTIVVKKSEKGSRVSFVEFKNISEYLRSLESLHFIKIEGFTSAEYIEKRILSTTKVDKLTSIFKRLVDEGVKIKTVISHLVFGTREMGQFGSTCKYLIHFNNPFPHPRYSEDVTEKAFVQCFSVQNFNDRDFLSLKKSLTFHQVMFSIAIFFKFLNFNFFKFFKQTSAFKLNPFVATSCYRIPLSVSHYFSKFMLLYNHSVCSFLSHHLQ